MCAASGLLGQAPLQGEGGGFFFKLSLYLLLEGVKLAPCEGLVVLDLNSYCFRQPYRSSRMQWWQ